MKYILLALLITISSAFAEVKNQYMSQELLNSKVKIIDIRTPSEWAETGIIKGSIAITFFNEQGAYNIDEFLKELNKNIKQNEEFAMICRSGSRTKLVSNFLSTKFGYNVINIQGGILYALGKNFPIEKYKAK